MRPGRGIGQAEAQVGEGEGGRASSSVDNPSNAAVTPEVVGEWQHREGTGWVWSFALPVDPMKAKTARLLQALKDAEAQAQTAGEGAAASAAPEQNA